LAGHGRQQMRRNRHLLFPLDLFLEKFYIEKKKERTLTLPDINTKFKTIFETIILLS
jgi:hypothetical protein